VGDFDSETHVSHICVHQELNIMNDLSHPNVVQLIGVSAQFKQENPESFYFGYVYTLRYASVYKTKTS